VQNSNVLSHWADDVEMDEFYEDLSEDIEIISGAYQSIAKFCKKGGVKKRRQCLE
jgi:hypothetical protein